MRVLEGREGHVEDLTWSHGGISVCRQEVAIRGLKLCFTGKPGSSIPGHGRFT